MSDRSDVMFRYHYLVHIGLPAFRWTGRMLARFHLVAAFSCVPPSTAFYVQDSARLKNVTIIECNEVTFREIDNGSKAKRQACTKRNLNAAQRRVFEKHRSEFYDPSLVPVAGIDDVDEGP